ncbi:hypothetical protein RNJ44_01620 [Nakaseomyces bracarensis]|uniref:Hyphally-regulated cell wall protein N-terminal domain-containing protein n=1 Tax=Nakaseomyces bracarensis TaxID=273131 RepID=A0ABR4NQ84_9SACH
MVNYLKPLLLLGLFGLAKSDNDDLVATIDVNVPHYVWNSTFISDNTHSKSLTIENNVETVDIIGAVQRSFVFIKSKERTTKLEITSHGLGGYNDFGLTSYFLVDNSLSTGPLQLIMTGGIFDVQSNGEYSAVYGTEGTDSTAYFGFNKYNCYNSSFHNMKYVTFQGDVSGYKYLGSNSNIYFEGGYEQLGHYDPNLTPEIQPGVKKWVDDFVPETQNSVIWFNGLISSLTQPFVAMRFLEPFSTPNVFVINDAVPKQEKAYRLYNFDSVQDSYMAFPSKIKSFNYSPSDSITAGNVGILTVTTANGDFSFTINNKNNPDLYSNKNFLTESIIVDRNGTDNKVYAS